MQQGEAEDFADELAEDFADELAGEPEAFTEDAAGADYPAAEADGFPDAPAGLTADAEGPAELRSSTGEPRVDAALARLGELAGRPVTEHRAVFDDVHRRLRDVLGELDSRQPQPAGDGADSASRPAR
jgi:hypothetical protein